MWSVSNIRRFYNGISAQKRRKREFSDLMEKVNFLNETENLTLSLSREEYERMTIGQQLFMMLNWKENIPLLLSLPEKERPSCGGMG